jgi:hypothetical protein
MYGTGVAAVLVEGLLTLQHGLSKQSQLLLLVLLVLVNLKPYLTVEL